MTCLETPYEKDFESETYNLSYTCIYALGSKSQKTSKKCVKMNVFTVENVAKGYNFYEMANTCHYRDIKFAKITNSMQR